MQKTFVTRLWLVVAVSAVAAGYMGCDGGGRGAERRDLDGDGVPRDRDLCPQTAAVDDANSDGCGAAQVDAHGNPLVGMSDAFETFVVDPDGEAPVVFRSLSEQVTATPRGFRIEGTLLLSTPVGHITLLEASVELETTTDDPLRIDRIRGSAGVPFPDLGFMAGFETKDLVRAELGLDYGANLAHLGAPLADTRRYVFFAFRQGVEASNGPITIKAPGGADALIVIDPHDPMIYVQGSLLGLGALGPVEDVGLGLSLQGLMPFAPAHTLAGRDDIGAFDGHLYVTGRVPLARLPLVIDGEVMVDLDPDGDGATPFGDDHADLQLGANGAVELNVDFLKVFSFGFELGSATAVVSLTEDERYAYVSGTLAPDTSWLPDFVPLVPSSEVHVEALLADELAASYVSATGHYELNLDGLAARLGLDLDVGVEIDGAVDISREHGVWLRGTTRSSFSPLIALDGEVAIEARFREDLDDWFIELSGALVIGGARLAAGAKARLSSQGLFVTGAMETGVSTVAVAGEITAQGAQLSGEAAVFIDIVAGKAVVETIVDGAVCGYAFVTNGAVCGYETITDSAVCGWDLVTSGAKCGYETVTSAVQCGVETVGCWILPWKWGTCTKPKSCQVPASCKIPKTCTDFSAPKSCTDWSQPLACDQVVTVPDFDWGDFVGTLAVEIGTGGVGGSVSGEYCPADGACLTIAGGRLRLGDPMRACVTIPGELGEFCATL